ncbi:S-adenosyl-L-methionine-dependent methyltransferase [Exidia glandulosa HHB12029]|uniref:S-adenosyl-L-methionine-dependent methyltransferase n=1 Tax=Exidia glandulosa HHB12029 TaxID=1314781 RepID=A0A165KI89_EXIGL|nr:S-adenosyl-L-methionine-dependent methyltransferase [Exidia glandulosa HHB12029]
MSDLPPAFWALCELAAVSYGISSARLGYSLVVNPLYGSTAGALYLDYVLAAACALAALVNVAPVRYLLSVLACMLYVSPITAYYAARFTARWHDYQKGPFLVHLLVMYPLVVVAISSTRVWRGAFVKDSIPARVVYGSLVLLGSLGFNKLGLLTPGGHVTSTSIFLSLGVFCMAGVYFAPPATARTGSNGKAKKAKFPVAKPRPTGNAWAPYIFPSLICFLASLAYPNRPLQPLPYTDSTGVARIIAASTGVTGRIVVEENLEMGFRFLRADHSLLGGQWIDVPQKRGQVGDSIYTAFLLQEGVRFVQRASTTSEFEDEKQDKALIIGLGIGVSAGSFIHHGMHTTVVEIDPVVYDYARTYFGLREPHAVHLTDARGWVHTQAAQPTPTHKYDIVVHDCFSGGSVPGHIFTLEFWGDLQKLLAPDGVVAVNYAGYLGSNPARGILATLLAAFTQCRIFHDSLATDHDDSEFLNMVFFCTNAETPMTFRKATPKDSFKSIMRERLFEAWPRLEVSHGRISKGSNATEADEEWKEEERKDWVLTDAKNPLAEWQHQSALEHWHLMRGIMSDVYWELF